MPGVYAEAFRVLKPGGCFSAYEYSLTDRFDEGNAEHQRIKAELEYGGGVPDIPQQREIDAGLRRVGFELVEARDLTAEGLFDIPWYEPLIGSRLSFTGFRRSAFGRKLTNAFLWLLEWLRIMPRGTARVAALLNLSADAHAEARRTRHLHPGVFRLCPQAVALRDPTLQPLRRDWQRTLNRSEPQPSRKRPV